LKVIFLSKRECKELTNRVRNEWGKFGIPELNIEKKVEVDEDKWLLVGEHTLIIKGEVLAPFIGDEKLCSFFPYITIDMGAIRFITNGANVMRPGIKDFPSPFVKDDIVIVKDEKFGKLIAVCSAIMNREEAISANKGAILKNISYVGDKFWEVYKEFSSVRK
jgi:PUA domain protein